MIIVYQTVLRRNKYKILLINLSDILWLKNEYQVNFSHMVNCFRKMTISTLLQDIWWKNVCTTCVPPFQHLKKPKVQAVSLNAQLYR